MAARFDAATDRYETTTGLTTGTTYTVVCWFYISVDRFAYSNIWELQYGGRSQLNNVYITDSKLIELWDIGGPKIAHQGSVGVWQRLAVAVNGGDATFYYGTATGALAVANTTTLAVPSGGSSKLLIGNDIHGQFLNGKIAPKKWWNVTLGPEEIERELSCYQPVRTSGLLRWHPWVVAETVDYSGNGNNLTAGSTATTTEDGPPIPWGPSRPRLMLPSAAAAPVNPPGAFFPFFP